MFILWLKEHFQVIALLHLVFSSVMAGIVWDLQTVQYPALRRLPFATALVHQRIHMRKIFWLVMPPMVVELILATAIWISQPGVWPSASMAAVVGIWLWTLLFIAPTYRQLALNPNTPGYDRLIRGNWPRTVAWTFRVVVALLLFS